MLEVTHDRPVLLVSDQPERAERLARAIALVLPVQVVARDARLPVTHPIAWVVDLDLERTLTTPWFDDLCSCIQADAACLYLKRGNGARENAGLTLLGAPTVLSIKQPPRAVVAALVEALNDSRLRSAASPVERNLAKANGLVLNVFTAAATGQAPSPAEADQGTEIVLDTISEVGIRAWLDMIWRHDITVYQHSLSVAGYAAAFATELGFSRGDRHRLAKAALLHDVGKARIPLAILNKPGPLTSEEEATMRMHAAIGADLLAATGKFERDVLDVARFHHERLDGSGYPNGLTGSAIGDLVRLVSICDVYSALTERRVYRPAMPAAKACAIIDGMKGQLDFDLWRAFRPVIAGSEEAA